MKLIGIDPSTIGTAYAVIEDEKLLTRDVFKFKSKTDRGEVLNLVYHGIKQMILKHDPELLICEDQFAGRNIKTYGVLKEVVGVIRMAAYDCGIPMILYSPTTVKKSVGGKGNSKKEEVAKLVNELFGIEETNMDITDACAIGLTYFIQNK
jgi:crossover junction endodeoxyribonuclease RuvC